MADMAKDLISIRELNSQDFEQLENSVRQPIAVVPTEDFKEPSVLYQEIIDCINKYHPNTDISLVKKAYELADGAHKGQKRKSGEPYIIHPLCVGVILADLEMDKETIVAGILHDVVEDTQYSMEDIEREFSPEIATLVDGVTKLGQLSYSSDTIEIQAENLRKMFLAMAKDIRVIIIKLADRLHNMRTLKYMKPEKQRAKAVETMEIYAPLSQRLGISKIKSELDDLSLKYIEPQAYYDLVEKIALRKAQRDEYVNLLIDKVSTQIKNAGIKAKVEGRAKHFFSIYKKMVNQGKTLDQIYDLFAIRIIVENVKDCYGALGVIHEMYTPIPGRFKDYIAMPKPNMYQSLHTSVIGPNGSPFEIQIRTEEMHRTSEYGIAAHWKYKESGEGSTVTGEEEKLSWLRQILEWQQDMSDNREFVSLLKNDLNLFSDTVFCFTPQGDIKNLPKGSTPIDFAYSIHSAVGNRMVGAKVNGRLVPLSYSINNGDQIEIVTSNNSKGPSHDWLNFVKSTQAKTKINQFFRSISKEENIARGRELITEYAKQKGKDINILTKPQYIERVSRRYGFHDWNGLLAAVGNGSLREGMIVNRLMELYHQEKPVILSNDEIEKVYKDKQQLDGKHRHSKSGVIINGSYDMAVKLSGCCNPVPGDEIVGFITRGRGVTVHRTDCINIISLGGPEKARLVDAEWDRETFNTESSQYLGNLHIYANDRFGLLNDIVRVLTEAKIDIQSINTRTSKQGIATLDLSISIGSRERLQTIIDKISAVESVINIERGSG